MEYLLHLILMDNFKLLCWNMRGLNSSLKKQELVRMVSRLQVNMGAVLETRVRPDNWKDFVSFWKNAWHMEVFGNVQSDKNCRIMVFWNGMLVDLQVEFYSDQLVHCLGHSLDGNLTFYCSFIYAHNSIEKSKNLWKDLLMLHSKISLYWIVMGDLNVVLTSSEIVNGSGVPSNVGSELADVLAGTSLHDHKYVGQQFTWDNGTTFCKLDRVLVNDFWEHQLTESVVDFLPKGISDHAVGYVKVFSPHLVHLPPFRFKNLWAIV